MGGLIGNATFDNDGLLPKEFYKRVDYPFTYTTSQPVLICRARKNNGRIMSSIISYGVYVLFGIKTTADGLFSYKLKSPIKGDVSLYYHTNTAENTIDIYMTGAEVGDYIISEHWNTYEKWDGQCKLVESLPEGSIEIL